MQLQAGVIEEIVNDAVDTALVSEDIEDEIDGGVDKVLTAITGEKAAQRQETEIKATCTRCKGICTHLPCFVLP